MSTQAKKIKRKTKSVSSFLKKTYQILEQQLNSNIIRWSHNGIGFIITKQQQFSKQILPKYFKHSNYSSFVRQLNMYNFHKIRQINYQSHFHHQCFVKDKKDLLADIHRKPEKKKRKNQDQQSEYNQQHMQGISNNIQIYFKNITNNTSNLNIHQNILKKYQQKNNNIQIKSQISTDKKYSLKTHSNFFSQKQNQLPQNINNSNLNNNSLQYCVGPSCNKVKNQQYNSKQRVSIQDILYGGNNQEDDDDDKISINNQIVQSFPRYTTKEMIYPSSNNIYQLPFVFKGGSVVSQGNLFF